MRLTRIRLLIAAPVLGVVAALTVGAVPTAAGAARCSTDWGSLPKSHAATVTGSLVGVRSGRHECYDRLVIDVSGPASGYRVEYVAAVTMDGSGQAVPLRGGARLQVVALAPAYDAQGNATYHPANPRELVNVTGYTTLRQVAWAGSFEGQTTIGVGVRARLPFTVFTLAGPGSGSRLVVDVAHTW